MNIGYYNFVVVVYFVNKFEKKIYDALIKLYGNGEIEYYMVVDEPNIWSFFLERETIK